MMIGRMFQTQLKGKVFGHINWILLHLKVWTLGTSFEYFLTDFFKFLSNAMYIRSIFYLVVLILDKGAVPRNVEIKFYKVFKSFILLGINAFKTWDKEVFDKLYIYICSICRRTFRCTTAHQCSSDTYIYIYTYTYICTVLDQTWYWIIFILFPVACFHTALNQPFRRMKQPFI